MRNNVTGGKKWLRVGLPLALLILPPAPEPSRAQQKVPAEVAPAALKLPSSGVSVLPPFPAGFKLAGGGEGRAASARDVAVGDGQAFTTALRVQTIKRPARDRDIRLLVPTSAPIEKGDVLVATFWLRGVETRDETGEAVTLFNFERAGAPFTKSADVALRVAADQTWRRFQLPFAAKESYAAGQAQTQFRLGFGPQTIEVGGLSVVSYGKQVRLADFPRPRATYAGREPNAPWRKAAQERIEKIRKSDLSVRVTDAAGRPVANAQVRLSMKRHAFGFGSAVNGEALWRGPDEDRRRYRDAFVKLFNITVEEGAMKWRAWQNAPVRQEAVKTVQWARNNQIRMRGHTLLWPSWERSPSRLKKLYEETKTRQNEAAAKEALRSAIREHITDIAGTFAGKLSDWDVINETYANHDLVDVLGKGAMVEWFTLARVADPHARLFLNENSVLNGRKANFFAGEIKYLLDHGAPLGGIGIQGHVGPMSIPQILSVLDRFGRFNLPIQITEFDIATGDEALQGDFLRDFLTAAFSHPAVSDVVMWGFWEGRHWRPERALLRKDWSVKPSGQAWTNLVHKAWWTNVAGNTDARGEYKARGFLGDYEVTVRADGRAKTLPTALPKNGKTLTVVLD